MTKSFKKRLHRAIAVVMAVAMLVGTLPAEMLGGIASVKAAESMVVNFSDDAVQTEMGKYAAEFTQDITIGDFTLNAAEGFSMKYNTNNKSIDGFTFTHRMQLNGAGSIENRNVSFATTGAAKVVVYAMSGSNGKTRELILADSTGTKVGGVSDDGTAIQKKEYDITSAGTYYLYSGDSGINIYYISVTPVESEGTTDGDEMVAFERTYNLKDGSIVPTDTDGKSTVTSADGLFQLACGPNNAYGYNSSHGTVLKQNNVITLTAGEGSTINNVGIALCSYNANPVTVVADGETVATDVDLTSAICYKNDSSAVKDIAIEGGAEEVTLTFGAGGGTYCCAVIVSGMEPKPEVTEIQATIDVSDPDALLGASDKILLVEGTADGEDVT
ncbi:MAG: hypothetical protein E7292_13195, partial [Lachnospiraceae bacterium]|nr:hypothetical protein [Lachnospiraceae bacterium]